MKCLYPIELAERQLVACRKCILCKVEQAQMWKGRILLEGQCHAEKCMVTATYDDEHLPQGGTLVPEHYRDWLKRVRERWRKLDGRKLRFLGCGEYGPKTGRPHYHTMLFGVQCHYGYQRLLPGGKRDCTCDFCTNLRESWSYGFVKVSHFDNTTAGYMAEYPIKKLFGDRERDFLKGRAPQFIRRSSRPGIGVRFIPEMARIFKRADDHARKRGRYYPDVPVVAQFGRKRLPLGRHMRTKLREAAGRDGKAPAEIIKQMEEYYAIAWEGAEILTRGQLRLANSEGDIVRQIIHDDNAQRAQNIVGRMKIRGRQA
jgi:hypothetical protein